MATAAGGPTAEVGGGAHGVGLGWTTGGTGLAAVDDAGRLTASGRVRTGDEVATWPAAQRGRVVVAAVDAPWIVPNDTGRRVPERLIGQAFGGSGASAHTANRSRPHAGDTRARWPPRAHQQRRPIQAAVPVRGPLTDAAPPPRSADMPSAAA